MTPHGVRAPAEPLDQGTRREAKRGRTFAAAPNFAFEHAADRGLPPEGEDLDLSNVAV